MLGHKEFERVHYTASSPYFQARALRIPACVKKYDQFSFSSYAQLDFNILKLNLYLYLVLTQILPLYMT